jgi:hypothetical protein
MAEQDLDDAEYERIARQVEAEEDDILVPFELIGDYERPPGAAAQGSLYTQILTMTVSEKVKLALRGNKDARTILVRDASKMIRRFVLQNPRIGDGEVVAICRNRSADDELLRTIAEKREWMRNYQVRLALATNPKTPLPIAIRQVNTLGERDLQQLAKSRNVPQAVAVQARRLVVEKREKR